MADDSPDHLLNQNPLIFIDERPTRADAVKNRLLLLETARKLFREKGPDCVSMSEIAQAAGVGKGTLYRHFTSKAEVSFALLDHEQRELQEATIRTLRKHADEPAACLRWFLPRTARFTYDHSEMLYFGTRASDIESLQFPAHIWQRQTIRGLLERMGLSGDLDYLSDSLYVMLDVNTIYFQKNRLGYDLERIATGLLEMVDRLDSGS
jgi:AcrR family transcriptional regulator